MQNAFVTTVVRHQVNMELVDEEGTSAHIETELVFSPTDPFAATIVFKGGGRAVPWTFARDLLVAGRYEPIGDGDVHVWPCLADDGSAVVVIELASPAGSVMVQAPSREVHRFVHRMLASVPQGNELDVVDLDAQLQALLAR
jgi:hypothetical protein